MNSFSIILLMAIFRNEDCAVLKVLNPSRYSSAIEDLVRNKLVYLRNSDLGYSVTDSGMEACAKLLSTYMSIVKSWGNNIKPV